MAPHQAQNIEIGNLIAQIEGQDLRRGVRRMLGGVRFRFAPTVDECLIMLAELEAKLGGERDAAQVVGPSIITVRSWKRRKRMSVPARRLVWLVWALLLHPETVETVEDIVTWGRLKAKAAPGAEGKSQADPES